MDGPPNGFDREAERSILSVDDEWRRARLSGRLLKEVVKEYGCSL